MTSATKLSTCDSDPPLVARALAGVLSENSEDLVQLSLLDAKGQTTDKDALGVQRLGLASGGGSCTGAGRAGLARGLGLSLSLGRAGCTGGLAGRAGLSLSLGRAGCTGLAVAGTAGTTAEEAVAAVGRSTDTQISGMVRKPVLLDAQLAAIVVRGVQGEGLLDGLLGLEDNAANATVPIRMSEEAHLPRADETHRADRRTCATSPYLVKSSPTSRASVPAGNPATKSCNA